MLRFIKEYGIHGFVVNLGGKKNGKKSNAWNEIARMPSNDPNTTQKLPDARRGTRSMNNTAAFSF